MLKVLILYSPLILLIIAGIPGLIWGIRDDKRREREAQEQEEASASAVTQ